MQNVTLVFKQIEHIIVVVVISPPIFSTLETILIIAFEFTVGLIFSSSYVSWSCFFRLFHLKYVSFIIVYAYFVHIGLDAVT